MPPNCPSPFPNGKIRALWEAIVQQYQLDPQLAAAGVKIQAWSGDMDDVKDFTIEDLPGIRITPNLGPLGWTDETRLMGDWPITIDYAVVGTCLGDLMDFAECIKSAWPCDTANMAVYQPLGLVHWRITMLGLKPTLVAGCEGIASSIIVTCGLNVDVEPQV